MFATLLNDNIVPFGVRGFDLCVLPIRETAKGCEVWEKEKANAEGFPGLGDWLRDAEELWRKSKKDTTEKTIYSRLNHNRTLEEQFPTGGFRVIYNKSGTNLSSAVINASQPIEAGGLNTRGFIAEGVVYHWRTESEDEAQ